MPAKLLTPFTVKGVTLKNRIVMSPMCMYSSYNEDGMVQNWHRTHYVSRAVGQVGLIILESTAVTPQGRISTQDLGIWNEEHIGSLRQLVDLIREQGAKVGIQINHAGRKAVVEGEILAPSAIAFNDQMKTPKEMTKAEIAETVEAFKQAAARTQKAGFDIIELHGAHGYLINQFLSPLANHRTDEYGGTAKNRYRFLREVIAAVKSVWDGPLFIRISANDYHEQGLTTSDYVTMAKWMKDQGVDFIDVSSGGVAPIQINDYPGYQVKFSEEIKHGAEVSTSALGLITSAVHAEEILQNDRADLIFLGRALLRDPYWPRTAAKVLGVELESPKQYKRGWN
ncbi:NADPH dehydrogenase NamA [Bacillus sp. EB600]|uniref:NADPH dehydrogenase NamA n=1 Tax=Bacillus sp. EB600 TaxID=2806345 RepID=UPI00210E405C|nr:NADPH dehydrogenase NamA [Bacillus sp. EB600]MCQ6278003.1 NADPH dehydrogenase NamA [Bacillus sp. EB600]